ncbi:MAG: hypothetical protein RIA65_06595, partial [Woeseia sp.]
FRYTAPTPGTYIILLRNLTGTEFSTSYFERFDISITASLAESPDPRIAAGRLFAYSWNVNAGSFAVDSATDTDFFALVPGGRPNTNYIWKLDLNRFAGFGYNIIANSIGVGAPNSGYSTPRGGNSATYEYPVYLGVPETALSLPTEPPEVRNARFIDNANEDYGISPQGADGNQDTGFFEFDSDVEGTYAITIDTDRNGEYGNADDVLLIGPAAVGPNSVEWDGTDASNAFLANGTYNARIAVRMGEYHFVANDVETSGGDNGGDVQPGLTIFLSDTEGNTTDTQVYWDDITVLGAAEGGTNNLPAGASSGTAAGRHSWGDFDVNGTGFGNGRFIDTYVFGLTANSSASLAITADDTPLMGTTGTVAITEYIARNDALTITVNDADLNVGTTASESVSVEVLNNATGELEQIELSETGPNTGIFTADLPTTFGTAAGTNNDGNLIAQEGDTITVSYVDHLDAAGNSVTPTDTATVSTDVDNDGYFAEEDADDDNDGIPDSAEAVGDADGDGLPNFEDIDSDGDGVPDNIEAQPSGAGYRAPQYTDTDQDGLDDEYDVSNGGTPIAIQNSDSSDLPDYLDTDSDNDSIPDALEAHDADSDGVADRTAAGSDTDGDGLDDNFDTVVAPAAGNANGSNVAQQDTDADGAPDWRDADDDGDSTNTIDEDGNSNGNFADDDADSDGRPDYLESSSTDADGDGFSAQAD